MKKLFTACALALCSVAAVAQLNQQHTRVNSSEVRSHLQGRQVSAVSKKAMSLSGSRAANVSFFIDYDGKDEAHATANNFTYQRFIWEMNSRYSNADNFTLKQAAMIYDSIINFDGQGQDTYYKRSSTTMKLDSFDIFFTHENVTGNNDTVIVFVFNRNSLQVTGTGPAARIVTTPLWADTIVTNQTIPLNTTNFTIASWYPDLQFARGESFGIGIEFKGDTANKFNVLAGYRDECADACAGEPSVAGFSSLFYINYTTTGGTNISGVNSLGLDCNSDGTIGTPCECEEFYIQNYLFIPYVSAVVDYGAAVGEVQTGCISQAPLRCPGSSVNLNVNAFGGVGPYSYAWNATSGSLSSTTDPDPVFTVGASNSVITVTVTDGGNGGATTIATYNVASQGINITLNGGANPVTVNCGSRATLASAISGFTQGAEVYSWSANTGVTSSTATSAPNLLPGTYSVTVTNSVGCSATATTSVQYPGVSNSVSFQLPPDRITTATGVQWCVGDAATFVNTSQRTAGWNANWDFGDGNLGFTTDGSNVYTNPGIFNVKVTMDSAGCTFVSSSQALDVRQTCPNSVSDLSFESNVTLMPNPSTGKVTITIAGTSKVATVRVFNIVGTEVRHINVEESSSLDMSDLANGTYLVKVQSGEKTAVKKLIINH